MGLLHLTVFTVRCTLNAQCTVHSAQYTALSTEYTVKCTVYRILCNKCLPFSSVLMLLAASLLSLICCGCWLPFALMDNGACCLGTVKEAALKAALEASMYTVYCIVYIGYYIFLVTSSNVIRNKSHSNRIYLQKEKRSKEP